MSDTGGFDQGVNHYTVTIECTCGWTGTIANTFPRSFAFEDTHIETLIKAVTDGLELALIVHREGKVA
jgi:hypothetical protein